MAEEPKLILLSSQMSVVSIFACPCHRPPPPLWKTRSLLQVVRTTENRISTRPGLRSQHPGGKGDLHKPVLLPWLRKHNGVCFPLPCVTESSETAGLHLPSPHDSRYSSAYKRLSEVLQQKTNKTHYLSLTRLNHLPLGFLSHLR